MRELSRRLQSIDALRGLTVAAMLLVNDAGDWSHVQHKAEQLERRWIERRKSQTQKPDGMMETK